MYLHDEIKISSSPEVNNAAHEQRRWLRFLQLVGPENWHSGGKATEKE